MELTSLILKNIKYNIKKYIAYFLSLALIQCIIFMFFNFIGSNIFIKNSEEVFSKTEYKTIVQYMLAFTIAFIIYTTITFTKSRGKEFGIYTTIGLTIKEILRILFYENTIIVFSSLIVGGGIGTLLSRLFNMAFCRVMEMEHVYINLNMNGYKSIAIIAIVTFVFNFLYQYFFLEKFSITEILKSDEKMEVGKNSFIIGLLGLIFLCFAIFLYIKTTIYVLVL